MSYARVLNDADLGAEYIAEIGDPPETIGPEDITSGGRWWDLRIHDYDVPTWETEILSPHGWLPVVTAQRPVDTDTTTHDYSLEVISGLPTEVWTARPWTQAELDAKVSNDNSSDMVEEQHASVDKLLAVITTLNTITALSNSSINASPAATIKDVARELKTVARVLNREARLTAGRTDSTDTGPLV